MKTRTFSVPENQVIDFAVILFEGGLKGSIIDADQDDMEVEIEVRYKEEDSPAILELIDCIEGVEEEEDDDDDENEEEYEEYEEV